MYCRFNFDCSIIQNMSQYITFFSLPLPESHQLRLAAPRGKTLHWILIFIQKQKVFVLFWSYKKPCNSTKSAILLQHVQLQDFKGLVPNLFQFSYLFTDCWTDWLNSDDPNETGDFEILDGLRQRYPGKICAKPLDIQAQTLSGQCVSKTGDEIYK